MVPSQKAATIDDARIIAYPLLLVKGNLQNYSDYFTNMGKHTA